MLEFKLWVEEHDLFGDKKKALRQEIITTLEPNKAPADVTSSRFSEFGSDDSSRAGDHILDLFNKNQRIWELMAQAFPGEEETLKNRVTGWLNESKPYHQVADLFNIIGIGDDPVVNHATPKAKPQQPPAATNQPAPGLPDPAAMPGQPTF